MNIAIDVSQIVYEGTGVARYTRDLVENLLREDRENTYLLWGATWGQQQQLAAFFHSLSRFPNVMHKILPFPSSMSAFLWNKWHGIPLEYFIHGFDILHTSDWVEPKTRVPKVTTIHDMVVYKYPETSHPLIIKTQQQKLAWVKEESDMVICDSQATMEDVEHILHIEPMRLAVVYPGISAMYVPQSQEAIAKVRSKYGLLDHYALTVGTMEPRKNLVRVIAAFEQFMGHPLIAAKKFPMELVVVGKKGWGGTIPSSKYVKHIGSVPDEDLASLYSGARFFTHASLYEGFGFPILEAFSCNTPVVASGRGSLSELAGTAAVLADPTDVSDIAKQMVKIMVDDELRDHLIRLGRKRAEAFTWQKTAKEMLTLYRKVYRSGV